MTFSKFIALGGLALVWGCSDHKNLGVEDGKFKRCPDKPNCVSTQESSERNGIAPIPFSGSVDEAKLKLKKVVSQMNEATEVKDEGNYLRYEFRTKLVRFVDDVEFWFDLEKNEIHFRSASRIGYSDWGVNRKRMENIRENFQLN